MSLPRCSLCPCDFLPIPGDGPTPARLLFLGERPGATENKLGRVFCGPTGEEINYTYLRTCAGINRDDVRFENVVRCWALNNRTPKPHEILCCAKHFLPGVFARTKPEILILLGSSACKIIDLQPGEKLRLDAWHGRPFYGSVLNGLWTGWMWLSYHPAAGLHDGLQMQGLLEDFEHLGEWLDGRWEPPTPPDETLDYQYCNTVKEFEQYVSLYPHVTLAGLDTETHGRDPFSIQISLADATGRMLLASNDRVIREFKSWLSANPQTTWAMHFAVHDLDELSRHYGTDLDHLAQAYGIKLNPTSTYAIPMYRDTLQEAYHQSNLPQGLKSLVFRLFGYRMTSWEDTVWPASIDAIVNWLSNGMSAAQEALYELESKTLVRGKCGKCGHQHSKAACKRCVGEGRECLEQETQYVFYDKKPGAMESVLKHVWTETVGSLEEEDPYETWKKLAQFKENGLRGKKPEAWEWEWLEGMEEVGAMPILGIGNCTADQALMYACSDADWTRRVAVRLGEVREEQVREDGKLWVDLEDWDVRDDFMCVDTTVRA